MARCNNDLLLKKIGIKTLGENTEIDFRIRKDLADCRKINAKDYVKLSEGANVTFNRYRKPENRFECMRKGCVNTGLLMTSAANTAVTYLARFDATEFAAGVITFYVYPNGTAPVTVTVSISDKDDMANADVYTKNITVAQVTEDGFVPVVIDLSQTPSSESGEGWTANQFATYIQVSADKAVGYSSFAIFDSIEDFELNDVVTISCLTTVGGTFDLELVEAQCQESRYNDTVSTLTYPVTGTRVTPNYWKLNPLMGKGNATTGFDMTTVQKTIVADGGYGKITLADVNQDVCGYIAVQIDDSCDVTDAGLTALSLPVLGTIDEGHYQIIKNADGSTDLFFNAGLVGMTVLVRYPRLVEIEEMVATTDNLDGVHVSMVVPHIQSDGVRLLYVFENVYVTSFPATITTDTAEFAFTITIAKDDDGNFFRIQRIVGNANSNQTIYT